MSNRIQREMLFHDNRFNNPSIRAKKVSRYYSLTKSILDLYKEVIEENVTGIDVLEYGCGTGSSAFDLAKQGAFVTGIDISQVALEIAKAKAQTMGVETKTRFQLMNAECLAFANDSFDLVCGTGILHHLDIEQAISEITRVLRPSGKAVFIEPMGHNIFINAFRTLTPDIRSVDEHPLLEDDLKLFNSKFRATKYTFFYLTVLAAAPFIRVPGFNVIKTVFTSIDALLFNFPLLRKQAWMVLIELTKPLE